MKHNKNSIQKIACDLVKADGIVNLSRAEVCRRAGIPVGSFDAVMGQNFRDFRNAVRAEAGDGPAHAAIKVRRTQSEHRKNSILRHAVELSRTVGYQQVTRSAIADQAGVSPALVSRYSKTMSQLRRDIMRHAIANEVLEVIAQGLAANDPHARRADPLLQRRAADLMIGQ
jgi:AcrR family transcriptional regulator